MLRAARHWFTAGLTDAALRLAPRVSARTVDRVAALLARAGPHCPLIARTVAENMRTLGVYSPQVHRGYFAQLGAHFAGALHALRCAGQASQTGPGSELTRIAEERVELDESVHRLRAEVDGHRGVIIIGPHIANYLLNLTRLNQVVALTVYLRYSKDVRRRAAKASWYEASGVGWISEPLDAGGPLGRLGRMAAAVAEGRTLFVTPDLPQKRADGVPVRFFGREIYLPAGPALLALRTRAPLFALSARPHGARQQLVLAGPFDDRRNGLPSGRDARRMAVQQRMQWFATNFERFVQQQPALWYLWADKRWTRLLHNDARYVGLPASPGPAVATELTGAV